MLKTFLDPRYENFFPNSQDELYKTFLENIKKNLQKALIRDTRHNKKFTYIIIVTRWANDALIYMLDSTW